MNYLVIKPTPTGTPKSYLLTSTCAKPRLAISNSYIPLTTKTHSASVKLKCAGNLRAQEYVSTSTSASDSASYYTSSTAKANMSNTTALTSSSVIRTAYQTQVTVTGYSSLTRASTYSQSYQTRASTYAWSTTATQWDISSSITRTFSYGTGGPGWTGTGQVNAYYIQHIVGPCTYTETRNHNMSLLNGSFTRSESWTQQIPGGGQLISSSTVASSNTFLHNGTYGGPDVYSFTWSGNCTYLADALTTMSIYNTIYSTTASVYSVQTLTATVTIGILSTTGSIITGYSGVSSSSISASASAYTWV